MARPIVGYHIASEIKIDEWILQTMYQFSNRSKLTLGAISILLLGVLMFSYVSYLQINKLIHQEEEIYIQSTFEKWNQWAERNFSIVTSLADAIASSPKEMHHDSKFEFFLSQTKKSGDLLSLAYGLKDGFFAVAGWSIPEQYDHRKRPWYQTSKSLLTPVITWPYKSPKANSPFYISLTAPILKNEQFIGAVTGDVTIAFLEKNVFSELLYRGGSAFLIDESGRILIHNDQDWVDKHLSELDSIFLENQKFNKENYSQTLSKLGNDFDYSITSLKNSNFLLVLATDQQHERQTLKDELLQLLLHAPLVIILVLICFYFYNKKIFQPIIYSLEHDANTHLPNKSSIKRQISHRFLTKHKEGMLIIISIDNFNQLVAAYPKRTVLHLQNQVKSRIQNLLNANSLLGIFSENSFIAFNPIGRQYTGIERLKYIQSLSDAVTKVYHVESNELNCTFNIGASCFPSDSTELEQLIDNAVSAMASAREDENISYSLFVPEHNQQLGKAILLSNAIKKALRKREFHLVYQPQIDSRNRKVVGVEALIRWSSSEYGRMVSPAEFITVAEASDLIIELGDYVIDTAVKQISTWNKQGLKFGKVSINISPRQIVKDDFIDKLLAKLLLHKVDANQVELEITETTVLGNPQKSIEVMQALKNHGFSLAMDDFGTGYSSLEYLKIMPLDKLKIDQIFVRELHTDERDCVIVKMVVAMAQALGYMVLAEGVENKEQLKYLQANGCYLIQGYYFAKPMSASLLESFLTEGFANPNLLMDSVILNSNSVNDSHS